MAFQKEMRSELQARASMIPLAREAINDARIVPFNFAERVLDALAHAKVPARHFQLEVAETVFLGRCAE